MRDLETIEAALTLAETGHLTFATLHTSDVTFDLAALTKEPGGWGEYPKAVAWALQQAGHRLEGQKIALGDLPDLALFGRRHRFFGASELVSGPGLDFDEDQAVCAISHKL